MQASDAPLPRWTLGSRLLAARVVVRAFALRPTMLLIAVAIAGATALGTLDEVDDRSTIPLSALVSVLLGCVVAPLSVVAAVLLRPAEWHVGYGQVRTGARAGRRVVAVLATQPAGSWTKAYWFAASEPGSGAGRQLGRRVRDRVHAEGRPLRVTAWPALAEKCA